MLSVALLGLASPVLAQGVPANPALTHARRIPVDATHGVDIRQRARIVTSGSFLGLTQNDDFNRPDGSDIGPDWSEVAGDAGLLNGQGAGSSTGWMYHTTATADVIDSCQAIDFSHTASGDGLVYVALIFGIHPTSGDNIFVKIQDNDQDGQYDRVFCYKGINGSSWSNPYIHILQNPTSSGRLGARLIQGGDAIEAIIDTDGDGLPDESFIAGGIHAAQMVLGDGVGIGWFNQAGTPPPVFDNWNLDGPFSWNGGVNYCVAQANSTGSLGQITAAGTLSVSANDLRLLAEGLPDTSGVFYYGPGQGQSALGNGYRCVTGPCVRLTFHSISAGVLAHDFDNTAPLVAQAPIIAGSTWNFQAYYLDPGASGSGYNLSDAVSFTFTP